MLVSAQDFAELQEEAELDAQNFAELQEEAELGSREWTCFKLQIFKAYYAFKWRHARDEYAEWEWKFLYYVHGTQGTKKFKTYNSNQAKHYLAKKKQYAGYWN